MAVSVSRDFKVEVLHDVNAMKLTDRQQTRKAAIYQGEPKSLGVSEVMLGLMIIFYSSPLVVTELTQVVTLGVPWWSGVMFISAGATAIVLDKHRSVKLLQGCLVVTLVSLVLSVVAVIIYSVDLTLNLESPCGTTLTDSCTETNYATKLSRGVKSSLLVFTLAQMVVSSILCFFLYRQRRGFGLFETLTESAPPSPLDLMAPSAD